MYGTDMYGICPASAITQVGDRLGCDSDQCLVVAAQDRHGGKCRVATPHFVTFLLSLLTRCVSRVPVLLVIVGRSWSESFIELQNS